MTTESESIPPNIIGEKYAAITRTFLELHRGHEVTTEMIDYLGSLLASTQCELAGMGEAASILGVTKQRIYQLENRLPPKVAVLKATPLWLAEDLKRFNTIRKQPRDIPS